ncbi:MAG: shikimate kinase [Candidatus Izemoplasmatales bacterium]|jgi:shikimate dehydrogenase|nr:shikimate kinase [Candidatus Izemoplasmatales bacterium]
MYGLLGASLKHSFSKEIHQNFGIQNYSLFETDNLKDFFKNIPFLGVNVTIPYKESVIPFLDILDDSAKRIGCVNTIVRRNKQLIGYNTDYYGLKSLLIFHHISIENKKVLIIGNGGAAKTCNVLFHDLDARIVTKICRNPKEDFEIPFKLIDTVVDYDIIVNTTPIGMYPNNDDNMLFDLGLFSNCKTVIDLIYNPIQTKLLLEAKSRNIQAVNGLYMLVMQAKKSDELFLLKEISIPFANKVYESIKLQMINIVFIGLPLSGKSKYARLIAQKYEKDLIDTDESIETLTNKKISEIFEGEGEKAFRIHENDYVDAIYKSHGVVISTGGGMVLNHELMMKLKQNGYFIYLDKDPIKIAELSIHNRPLIKQSKDIIQLDLVRRPLYKKYQDTIIEISKDTDFHIREIEAKLNEYISH